MQNPDIAETLGRNAKLHEIKVIEDEVAAILAKHKDRAAILSALFILIGKMIVELKIPPEKTWSCITYAVSAELLK